MEALYLGESDPVLGDPSPSRSLRREERFERLQKALDALPPDYREVVVLARLKGLKMKEIAARMERSVFSVTHLLSRALDSLKGAFGDTESLGLPPRRLEVSEPDAEPESHDD